MFSEEQLGILKQGELAWSSWRSAHPTARPALRKADLREADLRGADLREADLMGADLHDADLSGADLGRADLSGADVRSYGRNWVMAV